MPGPPPKKPALRSRRNKASTRAIIEMPKRPAKPATPPSTAPADPPDDASIDARLPQRPCRCASVAPKKRSIGCLCKGTGITPWHPLTLSWWRDVWSSEFHAEYIRTDTHGLVRLAMVVDSFYWTGAIEDLKEIRLQEARFGLDVMSRRRLEWMVKRPAGSTAGDRQRPAHKSARPAEGEDDPRKVLTMVPRT